MVVRVDGNRDAFMAALKQANIGSGIHFLAVHTHTWYREHFGGVYGTLENTEYNSNCICTLPLFPDMVDADVDDVLDAVRSAVSCGMSI